MTDVNPIDDSTRDERKLDDFPNVLNDVCLYSCDFSQRQPSISKSFSQKIIVKTLINADVFISKD